MDSQNVGLKNPFSFSYVKKIKSALQEYEDKFIIIRIPVVSEVLCEEKLAINLEKLNCKHIQEISATKIRKKLLHQ